MRIYARNGHFLLQWWDPGAKGNLCERVDGDLIDALATARRVEQRLADLRTSNQTRQRISHDELVEGFLADVQKRADAGELSPSTAHRYRSALGHYLTFLDSSATAGKHTQVGQVDRQFALAFATFLSNLMVSPNGHPNSSKQRLRGQTFIVDTVRAMFEWAADHDRGNCLPEGFRNPFRKNALARPSQPVDPLATLDVNMDMVVEFVRLCDDYQRSLFVPILLYGLRASEPIFLFREHLDPDWLRVVCLPELEYLTKGRRDKRFPMMTIITDLWNLDATSPGVGLLYQRRRIVDGRESSPLLGWSLDQLKTEFGRRCIKQKAATAAAKQRVRDSIIRDAGGLTYDLINGEFHRIARQLGWPKTATLKDFRHLFASVLSDSGIPEPERRYLLGHAPSRDAITRYTHLFNLSEHYIGMVESHWSEVIEVLRGSNNND
ncbi:MAG: hypothetical protein R3E58_02865 [Phycisphaerae bacterium]|nr:hypothetical protein [Phycisphaerales bacterium]